MMKMKLLTIVSIVLVAVGVAMAAEVINVDIKGYNDNTPYIGSGAYIGNISTNVYDACDAYVWTPYYGGWGVPVGSVGSEALVGALVPLEHSSIYPVFMLLRCGLATMGKIILICRTQTRI